MGPIGDVAKTRACGMPGVSPPQSIDEAAITVDEAARLMGDLGFMTFWTLSGAGQPVWCLAAVIRDAPTFEHFDPERATFWSASDGRGEVMTVDRATRLPIAQPYSWGAIRLVDRLGARNSFVSFGGTLDADRIGADARLLIFSSHAPILRMRSHSQQPDRGADEIIAFFGRMVPHLWAAEAAEIVTAPRPEVLYLAFLLNACRRWRSAARRDSFTEEARRLQRDLELARLRFPDAEPAAAAFLDRMALA